MEILGMLAMSFGQQLGVVWLGQQIQIGKGTREEHDGKHYESAAVIAAVGSVLSFGAMGALPKLKGAIKDWVKHAGGKPDAVDGWFHNPWARIGGEGLHEGVTEMVATGILGDFAFNPAAFTAGAASGVAEIAGEKAGAGLSGLVLDQEANKHVPGDEDADSGYGSDEDADAGDAGSEFGSDSSESGSGSESGYGSGEDADDAASESGGSGESGYGSGEDADDAGSESGYGSDEDADDASSESGSGSGESGSGSGESGSGSGDGGPGLGSLAGGTSVPPAISAHFSGQGDSGGSGGGRDAGLPGDGQHRPGDEHSSASVGEPRHISVPEGSGAVSGGGEASGGGGVPGERVGTEGGSDTKSVVDPVGVVASRPGQPDAQVPATPGDPGDPGRSEAVREESGGGQQQRVPEGHRRVPSGPDVPQSGAIGDGSPGEVVEHSARTPGNEGFGLGGSAQSESHGAGSGAAPNADEVVTRNQANPGSEPTGQSAGQSAGQSTGQPVGVREPGSEPAGQPGGERGDVSGGARVGESTGTPGGGRESAGESGDRGFTGESGGHRESTGTSGGERAGGSTGVPGGERGDEPRGESGGESGGHRESTGTSGGERAGGSTGVPGGERGDEPRGESGGESGGHRESTGTSGGERVGGSTGVPGGGRESAGESGGESTSARVPSGVPAAGDDRVPVSWDVDAPVISHAAVDSGTDGGRDGATSTPIQAPAAAAGTGSGSGSGTGQGSGHASATAPASQAPAAATSGIPAAAATGTTGGTSAAATSGSAPVGTSAGSGTSGGTSAGSGGTSAGSGGVPSLRAGTVGPGMPGRVGDGSRSGGAREVTAAAGVGDGADSSQAVESSSVVEKVGGGRTPGPGVGSGSGSKPGSRRDALAMLVAADPDLRAYAGLLGDPEALPAKLRAYAAKPKKDLRLANAGISSFMWLNTILPGRVDQLALTGKYGPETLLGLYELLLRQPRQGDRAREIASVVAELLGVQPDPGSSNSWNPGAWFARVWNPRDWFGRWGGKDLPATRGEKTAAESVEEKTAAETRGEKTAAEVPDEKTRSDNPDDLYSDERALLAEESDAASVVSAVSDGSGRTDTTSLAEVDDTGQVREIREIPLEFADPMFGMGGSREPDTMPGTGPGQGAKPHDKPTPGGQSAVVWSIEGLSVAASRFEEAEQRRWKDQPRDVQSQEAWNLDDARARVRATYEVLIDAPGRDRERVFLAALRRGERHDALVTIAAHLMSGNPEALSVMPDLQVGARDSAEVLLRALARNLLQQPREAGDDNPAGTTQVSASSVDSGTDPDLLESYGVARRELEEARQDRQQEVDEAFVRADSILGPVLREYSRARVLMARQFLRFPNDDEAAAGLRAQLVRQMSRLPRISAGAGPEPGVVPGPEVEAGGGASGSSADAVSRSAGGAQRSRERKTANRRARMGQLRTRREEGSASRAELEEFGKLAAEDQQLREKGAKYTRESRAKRDARLRAAAVSAGGGVSFVWESAQVAGRAEAAVELSGLVADAEAGLKRMRAEGRQVLVAGVDVGVDGLVADMRAGEVGVVFGGDDRLLNVVAHYKLNHPEDFQGARELRERLHWLTAAAQLDEWEGIAGREAVDGLLADADGILGPLKVSERFRTVLARWLGEHPGDWRGAHGVRADMAGYLAGDPGIGMVVSGLTPEAFEEVRAEEARWQAVRPGNQAEAGAVAVAMREGVTVAMRGDVVDRGLSLIYRAGSVKRTLADAGRALRQLTEQEVDGLHAAAGEVLGPLKESRPFLDVMARELRTNVRDSQQVRDLRWKLVRYLAGDLDGGAEPGVADDWLSATLTPLPGNKNARVQQMYLRRVAVGKALSGLPGDEVKQVLRDVAIEELIRGEYSRDELVAWFMRSDRWFGEFSKDAKAQLGSRLEAAVFSLRQILADVEAGADLWGEYEAKIRQWRNIKMVSFAGVRRRIGVATAAVQGFRNDASLKLRELLADGEVGLAVLEVSLGRDRVDGALRDVERYVGPMPKQTQIPLRNALAYRLLTNGISGEAARKADAEAFLERLRRLTVMVMGVSAGAGPASGGDMLPQSAGGAGSETVDTRPESTGDVVGGAAIDDTEGDDFDRFMKVEQLELSRRLRDLAGLGPGERERWGTDQEEAGAVRQDAPEDDVRRPEATPKQESVHSPTPQPDSDRPYSSYEELVADLHRDAADPADSVNTSGLSSLGPNLFNLRQPEPAPDFLRGHDYGEDYSNLSAAQGIAVLENLDLRKSRPMWDAMRPDALQGDVQVMTRKLSNRERIDWAPAGIHLPLPAQLETPKVVHSVWFFGAPLSDAFRQNLEISASQAPTFLFVNLPRVRVEEAIRRQPTDPADPLTAVWDFVRWTQESGVIPVSLAEVSNADTPFDLAEATATEMLKLDGPGWAAASDNVRMSILKRFGGAYLDLDNQVTDVDRLFSAVNSRAAYAVNLGVDGDPPNNDAWVMPKGHRAAQVWISLQARNYDATQVELFPEALLGADFRQPGGNATRNSVLFRTGPGLFNDFAQVLEYRDKHHLPPISGIERGGALSWGPESATQPQLSSGRQDALFVAKAVVETLARDLLSNRDGDLHLTAVRRTIDAHPQRDLLWNAVVSFIASRPDLAGAVHSVTLEAFYEHGDVRLELPETASRLIEIDDDPFVLLGEGVYPAHLNEPVGGDTTTPSPIHRATSETPHDAPEESAPAHRSSESPEPGGRSARSDEESLADDSSEASSDSDVSESWPASGDLGGSLSPLESSVADLRGQIGQLGRAGWSREDEDVAREIVRGTHDHRKLLGNADLSLDQVVALVAAKYHELGRDRRVEVVEFSRALADRLGTRGSGLRILAGAGPEESGRPGLSPRNTFAAQKEREREREALEARLSALEASLEQLIARRAQKEKVESSTRNEERERDLRVVRLRGALEELQARQAALEALTEWKGGLQADRDALPEDLAAVRSELLAGVRGEWEGLRGRIEAVQAELAEIADDGLRREQVREGESVSGEGQAAALSAGGSAAGSLPGGASAEVVRPAVVVELAGLVGRMEEHLAALPANFRPDVRDGVDTARQWVQLGSWTPEDLDWIELNLEQARATEEYLRNVRSSEEIPAGTMASSGRGGSGVGTGDSRRLAAPEDVRPSESRADVLSSLMGALDRYQEKLRQRLASSAGGSGGGQQPAGAGSGRGGSGVGTGDSRRLAAPEDVPPSEPRPAWVNSYLGALEKHQEKLRQRLASSAGGSGGGQQPAGAGSGHERSDQRKREAVEPPAKRQRVDGPGSGSGAGFGGLVWSRDGLADVVSRLDAAEGRGVAADVESAMGEVAEAHAELPAEVSEVLHGLGVREAVDRFVGYVLARRPFALRVVEQTPELRGVGGTAVELLTAIAGGFERSAWSALEGGSAARDAFVTALAGWGVRFDGGLLPVLMDELPEGVDVRGVLDATVMRPYTEGLLGVEALVVGWPGDGLSIRAWHVSGFDAAFEQQFPPDLGVDARFSSYSVLVVDSQGQRRAPVELDGGLIRLPGLKPGSDGEQRGGGFVGGRERTEPHAQPAATATSEAEVEWWPGDDELAARGIVQGTHDHRKFLGDVDLSLDEVVALVAAKYHELGRDRRVEVVEFSRALADRLGTRGSGLSIHSGAGPEPAGGLPRSADVNTTTGRSDNPDSPERNDVPGSETTEAVVDDPAVDDAESDFDEEEFEDTVRPALLERLKALRGEPSGDTMPAAESAVDGDAVSAETTTPREAQGRMGKSASHEAILDAASKVEDPPEVAHRESSSSRRPVATSAAHADTGNYWASEHTDDPIDRFWSETPWRAEVDRATAALQMTIRGLRSSAAQTLRLGDPDITERESALTGPARQRAEELRAELVDRVAHRISQSDPGARLGWPVHDDATNLANDLRNSYQELLAHNAFDTEGDGNLGRFREDSAAALAEARDGLDRVAADLEQRWRDRGRDQLGISPEPEHSPAERAVLDDLALAVGRPYHQLDALTAAAWADGRPESDGAALQNFADDLAARARDDFGSIRDRFGSPPEQAAETVSEPGEHQQDAPAEESREGRPDSESAETNAEDPHYDSDSDAVPDEGFRSDMTPAKARASLQQLAGNERPNWHRMPPSLQQRFRTQAELLLGPLVETDQGQPAARERAEAYAQLRDVIAREQASVVFWNQTASLRKNLQAWFNHDGVERVSIDLSFAEANERREAAQAGDGLNRARTEFEHRWSAELGQGDRQLQELTDPGEQRNPLAGRDLSPRDQQRLRQQVEAALASRSDEVETQAREHAEMLGSLVSALASEMDAARQVAEEPELAGPLSEELLRDAEVEPGVAAARLDAIGDRFGSGVVEDLRVRAEGLLTDSADGWSTADIPGPALRVLVDEVASTLLPQDVESSAVREWRATELARNTEHARSLLGERPDPLPDRGPTPREQHELWQRMEAAVASQFDGVEAQAREQAEVLGGSLAALSTAMDVPAQVAEEPELAGPLSEELLRDAEVEPGVAAARLDAIGDRFGSGVVEDLRVRAEGLLTDSADGWSTANIPGPALRVLVDEVASTLLPEHVESTAERMSQEFGALNRADGELAGLQRRFQERRGDVIEGAKRTLVQIARDGRAAALAALRQRATILAGEPPEVVPGVGPDAATQQALHRDLVTVLAAQLDHSRIDIEKDFGILDLRERETMLNRELASLRQRSRSAERAQAEQHVTEQLRRVRNDLLRRSRDSVEEHAWRATTGFRQAAEAIRTWTRNGPVPAAHGEGWGADWQDGPSRRWDSIGYNAASEHLQERVEQFRRSWATDVEAGQRALDNRSDEDRASILAEAKRRLGPLAPQDVRLTEGRVDGAKTWPVGITGKQLDELRDEMALALAPLAAELHDLPETAEPAERERIESGLGGMRTALLQGRNAAELGFEGLLQHQRGDWLDQRFQQWQEPGHGGLPDYVQTAEPPQYTESGAPRYETDSPDAAALQQLSDRWRAAFDQARQSLDEHGDAARDWRQQAREMLGVEQRGVLSPDTAQQWSALHDGMVDAVADAGLRRGPEAADAVLARMWTDAVAHGADRFMEGGPTARTVAWHARELRTLPAQEAQHWRHRALGRVLPPLDASRGELRQSQPAHNVMLDGLANIARENRNVMTPVMERFAARSVVDPDELMRQAPPEDYGATRDSAQRALDTLFGNAIRDAHGDEDANTTSLAEADSDTRAEVFALADSILGQTLREYPVARELMAHKILNSPNDPTAWVQMRAQLLRQMSRLPRIRAGAGPAPGVVPGPEDHTGGGGASGSVPRSARVPFGELMPLTRPADPTRATWFDAWMGEHSETPRDETWYMRGDTRVSVDGLAGGGRVVLSPADLAGLPGKGRAAVTAFVTATGQAAQPLLADVDGRDVEAFLRVLDWQGVLGRALVVRKRSRGEDTPSESGEGTMDAWYVWGEHAEGEEPSAGGRLEGLRRAFFPSDDLSESDEFYVHVVDPVGGGVAYGVADQGLWRRGRDVEWGELFAVLDGYGPAELMGLVNPGLRRNQHLAQALGVDETTAQVWRMWSHLPEDWHAGALRRAIRGSVVGKFGGREAVKSLVEDLVPDWAQSPQRLRALGELMVYSSGGRPARRVDDGRDTTSAATFEDDLRRVVAWLGGMDQVAELAEKVANLTDVYRESIGLPAEARGLGQLWHHIASVDSGNLWLFFSDQNFDDAPTPPGARPDWEMARRVAVFWAIAKSESGIRWRTRRTYALAPQPANPRHSQPEKGELDVLRKLAQALEGHERDYVIQFFGYEREVAIAFGVNLEDVREWRRGRPGGRAILRGIVFDRIVAAFGGPERTVAVADRLRELGTRMGLKMASRGHLQAHPGLEMASPGRPQSASEAAKAVFGLPITLDWVAWTLGDVVTHVAEASVEELVRYLGPGRAIEVIDAVGVSVDESYVLQWLAGVVEDYASSSTTRRLRYAVQDNASKMAKLRLAVLRAIADGLLQPAPSRLGWSEKGIREAARRLAWAHATEGRKFPSDALKHALGQWNAVNDPQPRLGPESREVIDGLGKSLKASVNYIVFQVLLGNEVAKAMVEGSGIVIPGPGSDAATRLLEQIAGKLHAAGVVLASGDLRRVVGSAASERFQEYNQDVLNPRLIGDRDAMREFMQKTTRHDYFVLRVPPKGSQNPPRAQYVRSYHQVLESRNFFEGGQAHYYLHAIEDGGQRIDPDSKLSREVRAVAAADLDWWAQLGGLRASVADGVGLIGTSDSDGSGASVLPRDVSERTVTDIVTLLGGPAQVEWLDSQLPRIEELLEELLELPASVRLERLGDLVTIINGLTSSQLRNLTGRRNPTRAYFGGDGRLRRAALEAVPNLLKKKDIKWLGSVAKLYQGTVKENPRLAEDWKDVNDKLAREWTGSRAAIGRVYGEAGLRLVDQILLGHHRRGGDVHEQLVWLAERLGLDDLRDKQGLLGGAPTTSAQQRLPVDDEVAPPVQSQYAGPRDDFFIGARDKSPDGADSRSGRGGFGAGTGDSGRSAAPEDVRRSESAGVRPDPDSKDLSSTKNAGWDAGTAEKSSPEPNDGIDSRLTTRDSVSGDSAQSLDGDDGEVPAVQDDAPTAPARDTEPSRGRRTESPDTSRSEEQVSTSSVGSGTSPDPFMQSYEAARTELAEADSDKRAEAFARADAILGLLREYPIVRVRMAHHYLRPPNDQDAAKELLDELKHQMIRRTPVSAGAGPEPGGARVPLFAGNAGPQTVQAPLSASARLNAMIARCRAGLNIMRDEGTEVDQLIDALKQRSGMEALVARDGLLDLMAHYMLFHERTDEEVKAFGRKLQKFDWDERYERAEAQLREWTEIGIMGYEAVMLLRADADGILGPLKASERFRTVLAHRLGEHPGDSDGARKLREEMVGYLADDLGDLPDGQGDLGVAVSGLSRGALETVRGQEESRRAEESWRAVLNPAEVAAPMVRGVDVDPTLDVFSRMSSVQREFEEAAQALRQLTHTKGQDAVNRLYAQAKQVLGPLKESKPFQDVMARELLMNPRDDEQLQQFMKNPQNDEQLQKLRFKLASYLAGDLSGGADPSAGDGLFDATVPTERGDEYPEGYQVRVAVGKVLSGLRDGKAVDEVLQNEALEDALRNDYTGPELARRYHKNPMWAGKILRDARGQLISDLNASVDSLREILGESGTDRDLRAKYEVKITQWLDIRPTWPLGHTVRSRGLEAADAVRLVRGDNARRELRDIFAVAAGGFETLQDLPGLDHDVRSEFDMHFGGILDDDHELRDAVAHRLLTNAGQVEDRIGDAQGFLERLRRLRSAATAASAGAGSEAEEAPGSVSVELDVLETIEEAPGSVSVESDAMDTIAEAPGSVSVESDVLETIEEAPGSASVELDALIAKA
ncbi:hypothetical protein AB0L13_45185, partial [Saccharopolyspora shandongensis]